MQTLDLLETMYRDVPAFKRNIDRRLVSMVDRNVSVSLTIDFVAEMIRDVTNFQLKTCADGARDFIYRRLGWSQ